MSERPFDPRALFATIFACIVADGVLLGVCVWLLDKFTEGLFYFLLGGGPITVFVAEPWYSWFKDWFGERDERL